MLPHPPWGRGDGLSPSVSVSTSVVGGTVWSPALEARIVSASGWCGGRVATER